MVFVLTVDQISSRHAPDRVEPILAELSAIPTAVAFTRTVGDEIQAVLSAELSVVTAMLVLMRDGHWHIGVGIGEVDRPLPDESRRGRGSAFVAARAAVERAKTQPSHLAVESADGSNQPDAADSEAVLRLIGAVRERRTPAGWQAVDLADQGLNQQQIAERLSITRQAVSQRLLTTHWATERAAIAAATRLLARADRGRS